jgi:hypothetical protein
MKNKKPIDLGTREFKLPISKATVHFEEGSLIEFIDKDGFITLQLDPTELSVIYGAYMQMKREENENE